MWKKAALRKFSARRKCSALRIFLPACFNRVPRCRFPGKADFGRAWQPKAVRLPKRRKIIYVTPRRTPAGHFLLRLKFENKKTKTCGTFVKRRKIFLFFAFLLSYFDFNEAFCRIFSFFARNFLKNNDEMKGGQVIKRPKNGQKIKNA